MLVSLSSLSLSLCISFLAVESVVVVGHTSCTNTEYPGTDTGHLSIFDVHCVCVFLFRFFIIIIIIVHVIKICFLDMVIKIVCIPFCTQSMYSLVSEKDDDDDGFCSFVVLHFIVQ